MPQLSRFKPLFARVFKETVDLNFLKKYCKIRKINWNFWISNYGIFIK